jgi:RimJ/RimL family protein N-acetyltransferase
MPIAYPGPAYRIVTQRTLLRCWMPADAPLLKAAIDENIEHLRPWMPWISGEPTDLQAKVDLMRYFRGRFDLNQDYVYGIFLTDESRVLGGTGMHTRLGPAALEIGYWIHKGYINQGFATEISAALTKAAFEVHQVYRVEIHCDTDNMASAAVPRKLGFTHEATLRRQSQHNDELRDSMVWVLHDIDYPNTPSAQAEAAMFDALDRRIL